MVLASHPCLNPLPTCVAASGRFCGVSSRYPPPSLETSMAFREATARGGSQNPTCLNDSARRMIAMSLSSFSSSLSAVLGTLKT